MPLPRFPRSSANGPTLAGLLIGAVGAIALNDPRYRWIGFALGIIGGFLVNHGARRDSRTDSIELKEDVGEKLETAGDNIKVAVEKQIESFRREIATAKIAASSPEEKTKAIEAISNRYDAWASELVQNPERTHLEVHTVRLNRDQKRLEMNQKWRPVLKHFLDSLRRSVEALASKGVKVSADIPELPVNVMDTSVRYEGTVAFPSNVEWRFQLAQNYTDAESPPYLWLGVKHGEKTIPMVARLWLYRLLNESITLTLDNDDVIPRLEGIDGAFTFENYKPGLERSAQRMVQAQLQATSSP